jgi:hypothetical protein
MNKNLMIIDYKNKNQLNKECMNKNQLNKEYMNKNHKNTNKDKNMNIKDNLLRCMQNMKSLDMKNPKHLWNNKKIKDNIKQKNH